MMERQDHGQDWPQFKEVFGVAWPPHFVQWQSILQSQTDGEFSQAEFMRLTAGSVVPELEPLTSSQIADGLPITIRLIRGGERYNRKHGITGYANNDSDEGRAPVPIQINIRKKQLVFQGRAHDVTSVQALRWVKVLCDHQGDWISGAELSQYDNELDGVRTSKLRPHLPEAIKDLIQSKSGGGSRIRLGAAMP